MLDRLAWSEMFESFLASKYTAAKRFGLEARPRASPEQCGIVPVPMFSVPHSQPYAFRSDLGALMLSVRGAFCGHLSAKHSHEGIPLHMDPWEGPQWLRVRR